MMMRIELLVLQCLILPQFLHFTPSLLEHMQIHRKPNQRIHPDKIVYEQVVLVKVKLSLGEKWKRLVHDPKLSKHADGVERDEEVVSEPSQPLWNLSVQNNTHEIKVVPHDLS